MRELAGSVFRLGGCSGMARCDFFVEGETGAGERAEHDPRLHRDERLRQAAGGRRDPVRRARDRLVRLAMEKRRQDVARLRLLGRPPARSGRGAGAWLLEQRPCLASDEASPCSSFVIQIRRVARGPGRPGSTVSRAPPSLTAPTGAPPAGPARRAPLRRRLRSRSRASPAPSAAAANLDRGRPATGCARDPDDEADAVLDPAEVLGVVVLGLPRGPGRVPVHRELGGGRRAPCRPQGLGRTRPPRPRRAGPVWSRPLPVSSSPEVVELGRRRRSAPPRSARAPAGPSRCPRPKSAVRRPASASSVGTESSTVVASPVVPPPLAASTSKGFLEVPDHLGDRVVPVARVLGGRAVHDRW